ncbi:MAG TPA: hypothetical protein VEG32_04100 [Clostridia bacterium]|nr:hypothetical protein [Clostridia bacterium]
MNQVMSVFLKDLRHYWRETLAAVALLSAFGWQEVRSWSEGGLGAYAVGYGVSSVWPPISGLVGFLIPVVWLFVIARAIQGESLVGDRQFWVTRPFEWTKLLAAKTLFVLTFINLPLFVLDVFLLKAAGFAPQQYLTGLLWMQLTILIILVLPAAALATVTASVAQFFLALLLVLLYLIGGSWLSEQIPSSRFGSSGSLTGVFFIAVCLAVILLQYARRKTFASRLLIVGFGIACIVLLAVTPYRSLVARRFPQLSEGDQPPFQLALVPDLKPQPTDLPSERGAEDVLIFLPFAVSGIAPDSIVRLHGVLYEVQSRDGFRWDSGWKYQGVFLFPGQKNTQLILQLKRGVYERMKSSPVNLHMSLAVTVYEDKNRREFVVPSGDFALADAGVCSAEHRFTRSLYCRAPLRRPSFLLITADASRSTCQSGDEQSPPEKGAIARGWISDESSAPAEPGINPLQEFSVGLTHWTDSPQRSSTGICPGTPVTLSNPEPVRKLRTELSLRDFSLEEYRGPRR